MLTQGCIENKLQGEFVPYIMSSPIPDQCGQLLACMYQLMMLQYLRQLMNGEECTQVKGQGMFIIRKSDVYLFTFFISDKGMQIVSVNFIVKPLASFEIVEVHNYVCIMSTSISFSQPIK